MFNSSNIDDFHCERCCFKVLDFEKLVEVVSVVLIQEYVMAITLINGDLPPTEEIRVGEDEISEIIERRLKPKSVYHRDGLLFQIIMWIVTNQNLKEGDVVSLPHVQAADKGQDGIIIHRYSETDFSISICEDKATVNPRSTILNEVWPEVKVYESGGRRDELKAKIISTLGIGGVTAEESIRLIKSVNWHDKKRYRVRITSSPSDNNALLFKGFSDHVGGDLDRRRGEVVEISDLREWMERFTEQLKISLLKKVSR